MEKKIGADNIYRQLFNAPSRDNLIIYASCSFLGSCCFLERLSAFHAERNELFSLEYCSFSFFFLFPFYIIFSVHRFADSDKFYITPVLERNDVYVSNVEIRLRNGQRFVLVYTHRSIIYPLAFERINK